MPAIMVEISQHHLQAVALFLAQRDRRLQHLPPLLANLNPPLYVRQHVLVVVAREVHPPAKAALRKLAEALLESAIDQLPVHSEAHAKRIHLLSADESHQ
jgi:hypothetical protein